MTVFLPKSLAVTVILPTYNRADTLTRAIRSVTHQSTDDWELLIMDDGSTDTSQHIIAPFVASDNRIRTHYHRNKGLAHTKNIGLQAALGQWVTFLDSDDEYLPEHLASRINYMEAHPEVELIEGGFFTDAPVLVPDFYHREKLIPIAQCVLGPTFFGRRELFLKLKGFKPLSYGEDTEFWERAAKTYTTRKLTTPKTYHYMPGDDSITIREQKKCHSMKKA